VSLLAAGSGALAVAPELTVEAAHAAAEKPAKKPGAKPAAKPAVKPTAASAVLQKEFDRQRAATTETLETIRRHSLPPGGDLPVVFRPLLPARKSR
jgi:hypothetical protein